MAKNKTQPNERSVADFLSEVDQEQKRKDSFALLEMFRDITGEEAQMWGDSIIGFGSYHYKYESGREGDFLAAGFSPRKTSLSLYMMGGFEGFEDLLGQLGKYKTGKSCLYINKLEDVDLNILKKMIKHSYEAIQQRYS